MPTSTPTRSIDFAHVDAATTAKTPASHTLRNSWAARGLGLVNACLGLRLSTGFGILMYHRVVPRPNGISNPTWNVTPRQFRAQLTGLLDRGYSAWPLQRALAVHRAGKSVPAKTFVITFDDIYANVFHNAFPILRELNLPATVFLATAYLDSDQPFPFDDWPQKHHALATAEMVQPVSSAQCEIMRDSGLIELGTHTHFHHDYRGREDELRRDLELSLEVLHNRFGITQPSFAFPYGTGCRKTDGPKLAEVAREAGVSCALTTDSEPVRPADDPLNWGRFTAEETDSAASLAAKLDGWYSLARHLWQRLKWRKSPITHPAALHPLRTTLEG